MASPAIASVPVFHLGPFPITGTVVTTWGIMGALFLIAWASTRRLSLEPGPWQVVLEGIVSAIDEAIRAVLADDAPLVFPFVATLWIFIAVANLVGLVPGIAAPTGDFSLTAALAVLVFLSVHWYGLRTQGLRAYLRHYLRPNPILLPFHLVSEISRTLALAVRLFGNIMSLGLAALLVLMVAGLLVPVPLLMLHVVEALVQAYIFGMLALIYIAGAVQSHQLKRSAKQE
jgi:F-type H+-transporting ATPase subunit a